MRRLTVVVLMIAVLALPSFADISWEVGLSGTPIPTGGGDETSLEALVGFHFGISPFAILYASWDSLVMPPSMISGMTSHYDEETDTWTQGLYRPGFLNLFDVGLRILIRPFVLHAEIGTNQIHVYAPEEPIGVKNAGGFGANLRLAAGLNFGWWGVSVTGTYVAPTMQALVNTLKGLVSDKTRQWALNQIASGLVPSLMASVYF